MERRILRVGNSLFISLPPEFLRIHKLGKGDMVQVTGKRVLTVRPHKEVKNVGKVKE